MVFSQKTFHRFYRKVLILLKDILGRSNDIFRAIYGRGDDSFLRVKETRSNTRA